MAGQRRPRAQRAPDDQFLGVAAELIPGVHLGADPPHDQDRAAGEPVLVLAVIPDELVELGARQVDGAVDLAHQVAHRPGRVLGPDRLAETALDPAHGGHGSDVLGQHPDGVAHRKRAVRAQLHHQMTATPTGFEPVHRERRQLAQGGRLRAGQPQRVEQSGPVADGDGQPGRAGGQLRLGVGQGGQALGQPRGVGGPQFHDRPQAGDGAVLGPQVERQQRRVALRHRGHPALMRTVERLDRRLARGGVGHQPGPDHRGGPGGAGDQGAGTEQPAPAQLSHGTPTRARRASPIRARHADPARNPPRPRRSPGPAR